MSVAARKRQSPGVKASRQLQRRLHGAPTEAGEVLSRFYDSASVMMGTVELRGDDIVHISDNRASAVFFGTTSAAMEGRTARALGVPETFHMMWLAAYRNSVTSDGPVRFDYEHGDKGWLKVTVNYLGLSGGGLSGGPMGGLDGQLAEKLDGQLADNRNGGRQRFLYVVDDISSHKETERALSQARAQLELRVKERTAELEALNARLEHDALHDALTGLPNRLLFNDRLQHALARYQNNRDHGFAVLFIDLDHFKVINDSLGHPVGDALLVAVGERLLTCVREGDTVARFGGDEFTVLLEHCDAPCAAEVVRRLRVALARPFTIQAHTFTLSGSVGLVFSEQTHEQPQDLLRDADLAMYHAKPQHAGRTQVFSPAMRVEAVQRLELETDLRAALQQNMLEVYFQPIVRLSDETLSGFEALVRWPHPRGPLSPDAFVPLAEETGLVIELDRYVLRRACEQLSRWHAEFSEVSGPQLSVNVNLSSQQFMRSDLRSVVERTLAQTGLGAQHLNLEITERLAMRPVALVDTAVAQLEALGVGLCLDDFGTGYASLSYLQRFPATSLKLDRSFVAGIGEGNKDSNKDSNQGSNKDGDKARSLVRGVALIAREFGIRVVAEGIETEAQLLELRALGCEYGQGYLFGQPASAEETHALLVRTLASGIRSG